MSDYNRLWRNGFLYGGDYNPEQWLYRPETLQEDITLMLEAEINVVSLGMFSWSSLEPGEGNYNLDYLERIINTLYENGISSVLSTPSGARPPWMAKKYPEVLRTDENGIKQEFGERHNHCFTSPIYREKVTQINTLLAERFKDNPAVILWHISNEYEGECHCNLCQDAFRTWLRDKYKTIDELNFAWWADFWGHRFTDWDEISSPKERGDWSLDGKNLDWRRFVSDQTVDFYLNEIKPIREITPDIPCTTNFHDFINIGKGLNYWKFVETGELDIASWDNYPYWHNETHSDSYEGARRAFIHDINRSFLNKPFLLLESCPGATNWQTVNRLPKPGVVALQGMQAVAHGADSVQYFQIRKSLGASEKFHAAVIDHFASNETRNFKEVKALGEDLTHLDDVIGSMPDTKVAVIYDWEQKWALDSVQSINIHREDYADFCIQHYYQLWKRGISSDIIDMNQDLDKYDLVIAPMLYMVPEDLGTRLNDFVSSGGTLVTGPFSGIVDENQHAYTNGRPGPLKEAAGIWVEDIDGLYDSQSNSISGELGQFGVQYFCDLIHLQGAESLLNYDEDFYANTPSLTVNKFGEGELYYFGSIGIEEDLYDKFYGELLSQIMPERVYNLNEGMTVAERENDDYLFRFYGNFLSESNTLTVTDSNYVDAISGESVNTGVITFPPFSYRVFKTKK